MKNSTFFVIFALFAAVDTTLVLMGTRGTPIIAGGAVFCGLFAIYFAIRAAIAKD